MLIIPDLGKKILHYIQQLGALFTSGTVPPWQKPCRRWSRWEGAQSDEHARSEWSGNSPGLRKLFLRGSCLAMLTFITPILPGTLLLMSHPNRGFLAPKWVTHHFWEIHICGAAPLSINAILPICEGLIAARMTLCAVVNTSHPHIPETHQKSRMKAFVGWRQIEDFGLEMRCGRVRLTLFFPLHNSNFLYQIENVVCYPFRTANLVDNGTKEGQIGEGCRAKPLDCTLQRPLEQACLTVPHHL